MLCEARIHEEAPFQPLPWFAYCVLRYNKSQQCKIGPGAMYSQKNLAYFTNFGKNDDKVEIRIKAYHHSFTREFKPFPNAVIQSGGS